MDQRAPDQAEAGSSGEQLLVREAGDDDRRFISELLGRAGWSEAELDSWTSGASTLVLYDPADGVVRGAVIVGALAAGSFQLVAWAVEHVDDSSAATARLVRAAADRLRRSGAERLVVTLEGPGVSVDIMTEAGFGVVAPAEATTPRVILYQEL